MSYSFDFFLAIRITLWFVTAWYFLSLNIYVLNWTCVSCLTWFIVYCTYEPTPKNRCLEATSTYYADLRQGRPLKKDRFFCGFPYPKLDHATYIDVNSDIDLHARRHLCYSICLRHVIWWEYHKADTVYPKRLLSFALALAQHVLSYHQIQVPWDKPNLTYIPKVVVQLTNFPW